MYTLKKEYLTTRTMIKISVLGVISFVLMMFDFPLWFAPPFLKFDIADLPSLIGAFAMGPMAGVLIQFLKNVLNIIVEGSGTGGLVELSNFIVGSIFAYTAGAVYFKNKDKKSAVKGLIIGTLTMTLLISIINYVFMIPFYARVFGMPLESIVEMGSKMNGFVTDFKSLIIFAILPFNLLKGIIVSILTMLLYKRISPILHD